MQDMQTKQGKNTPYNMRIFVYVVCFADIEMGRNIKHQIKL